MDINTPLSIRPGETADVLIGYSEAACHLRVAGQVRPVKLFEDGMAQIHNLDGSILSFPVTAGEAGIYRDATGFYHYTDETMTAHANCGLCESGVADAHHAEPSPMRH